MATEAHRRAVTSIVGQPANSRPTIVTQELVPYAVETFQPQMVDSPAELARALERVQRHGADATQSARSLPCLGGVYWPGCKLPANQTVQLPHHLGVEVAFIPLSIRNVATAAPVIVEAGQSADHNILYVQATAECLADIWIFPRPKAVGSALAGAVLNQSLLGGGAMPGGSGTTECIEVTAYGAVGGNAIRDTAAIIKAQAASDATGLPVCFPPSPSGLPYFLTQEITAAKGAVWRGVGRGFSLIQAAASIRSFVRCQGQSLIEGIGFRGSNLAQYGFIFNGAANSVVRRCDFQSISINCFRSSAYQSGAGITLVSDSGGGPAISMIQPYPLALMFGSQVYVMLTSGGSNPTFQISFDGISYSGVNQTLFTGTTPIGQPFAPQLATDSGLALVTTAGTFTNGRVLHFSLTPGTIASNAGIMIEQCTANQCGTIHATSGVIAEFPGGPVVSIAGTATWLANNPVVQFNGAPDLTTLTIRDGDVLYLPGSKFVCRDTLSGTRDMGTAVLVLGPTEIYLDGSDLPTAPGTASDYAILVGGTCFTDPVTGSWNDYLSLNGGSYLQQANGSRLGALNPGGHDSPLIEAWGAPSYDGTLSSD